VWEQIGCFPDFKKFEIGFLRAFALRDNEQLAEALELAEKIEPLAQSINDNAKEAVLSFIADEQADLRRIEESIESRNKLFASYKDS
jgi:hypothetical protein